MQVHRKDNESPPPPLPSTPNSRSLRRSPMFFAMVKRQKGLHEQTRKRRHLSG